MSLLTYEATAATATASAFLNYKKPGTFSASPLARLSGQIIFHIYLLARELVEVSEV